MPRTMMSRVMSAEVMSAKKNKISQEGLINQHMIAFSIFLEADNNLEKIKRLYPLSFSFVQDNRDKTIEEVTEILQEMLKAL
jgi:hypothetical protein